ncbi:Arc family DNA binding domain-containing protein [Marilutibacter aestuarii]|uniref:Arc family DNA binding domain-containing protein n=1 Tax=Marilutibacter aestuarii TaxID=1706195 RepID=A0A507ZU72_9GAMM|nr:Arc family DNA binding domain-containing protein [Lysobacter aestuarii]TQD40969.1 Arc family DNA binding domain-containing protein [Lysobacter aestuarii]
MAEKKKAYPLRINADVLAAAQGWADDELRSLNAQIEYVLRDALRKAGRLPRSTPTSRQAGPVTHEEDTDE